MNRYLTCVATVALLAFTSAGNAATLNVLWYTGGVEKSGGPPGAYQAAINTLATPGVGDPSAATWNITYWTGGLMPGGSFNVLVVASPQGPWGPGPSYAALTAAAPTFGDRELVTGQDADFHFMNSPGPTNFNGPRGFLRDSINWAGSGTGMGLVALADDGPVLSALLGATKFAALGAQSNANKEDVRIPGIYASFPINTGLTSAGLSNWGNSDHDQWLGTNTTVWTGINTDGVCADPTSTTTPCSFVTLVSAATGGGGISGVPGPVAGAGLPGLLMAIGLLALWRRPRQKTA